jgi:HK97 family phage major capsid protein
MEEKNTPVEEPKVETPETPAEENNEVEKMLKSLMSTTKSEISEELKSDLREFMKEQKELMEKKAGLYAPEVKEKRKDINMLFKATCEALATKDDVKLKEMTTDATGTPYAGYTVDSELSAEIRHLITEYGVARREMSTVQLSKGEYKANQLVTEPTLYWVDEGAAIKSTQVVLGQESLTLKKLGAIVALTRELIEDGEVDLFSFVAGRLAEGFAKAEDEAFFTGAGSEDTSNGGFTGILNNTDVNEYVMDGATIAGLTANDILGMIDETPSGALGNAKVTLNRTIMSLIRKLQTEDGIYLYQAPSVSGPETLWGYPIQYSEVFPSITDDDEDTAFILFGDLKKACIFGYKGGISADTFNGGTIRNVADNADINLITTDRTAIRWIERVGYVVILPKALTVLKTGETSA